MLTSTATPTPTSLVPFALGLVDAHTHLPRGLTLDYLIKLMDQANVTKMVLMTVYYDASNPKGQGISDENLVLEFYKARPDRIIPLLGMQRPELLDPARWSRPDERAESLLRSAESQLRTGLFRGMGEFILWHYPYSFAIGSDAGAIKIPADTPLMKRFLDMASKYYVPVVLHYEIDAESLPALKRMLDYGRQTTVILAHNCGRPDPDTLKALLDEYPKLFCDLGGMTEFGAYGKSSPPPAGLSWLVKNPIEDGRGRLRPAWKALLEQYADRFVGIGTDQAHPEAWADPAAYQRVIARFRSLLGDLSPGAAERIGYQNAQKVLAPIPLVDVHEHVTPGLAPETIISLMDQAGVQKTVLFANQIPPIWPIGEEDRLVLAAYEKYPGRIIPFLTTVRWGQSLRDRAFLEYTDRQLAGGKFRGLGEFMVRHYTVSEGSAAAPDITVPLDSTWMQDMMCLGAKYNVPLVIHMETTPETVAALERALQRYPQTKVIWAHQNPVKTSGGSTAAHARKADPQQIAALLDKYPNLFADISVGYELGFRTDNDRQLPENWRGLYEKYNDRFVIGLDRASKETFEQGYVYWAFWMRGWLAQLSEGARGNIASENIERILAARPSPGQTCQYLTK